MCLAAVGQFVSGAFSDRPLSKLPFRPFWIPLSPLSLLYSIDPPCYYRSPIQKLFTWTPSRERERARVWDGCLIIQSSVKGQESAGEPNWHSASYWAPAAGSRVCPAVSLCASGTLEQEIDLPYCVNPTLTYRLSSPHHMATMAFHGQLVTRVSKRDHCFSIRTLSGEPGSDTLCWLVNSFLCLPSLHLVLTSALDNLFERGWH